MSSRLLIVDDEPTIRELCRRTLSAPGREVVTASTGEEALALFRDSTFDLVLTDLSMPGSLDGRGLLEEIKDRSPLTDVIMMTAFPTLETAIPTLKFGAYDYLSKPVDNTLLLSVVDRCFEKRRLSEELKHEKVWRQELEAAYSELQKVEKLKESFLSRLSHELRTPFVSVFYTLEQMRCRAGGEMVSMVSTLQTQINSLWATVENMLLFADLTHTAAVARHSLVEPVHLLQQTLQQYRGEADKKEVSATCSFGDGITPIDGDPQLLATAFKHLFLNAVYFNKRGGTITLSLRNEGEYLNASFADTGIGIPSDKIPKIFDGFYQAAEYMTREVGGLGLGLAIVRRIAEAHGGTVTVNSQPGLGSTFSMLLPRTPRRSAYD